MVIFLKSILNEQKFGDVLRYPGRVSKSCSMCDTCRVSHVRRNSIVNLIRSSHWGKRDGIVLTTIGKYTLSSRKRIFHSGQRTGDGVRKIYEEIV